MYIYIYIYIKTLKYTGTHHVHMNMCKHVAPSNKYLATIFTHHCILHEETSTTEKIHDSMA